ncbi:MAG: hypothetical protein WB799_18870, partial [Candidatus Sulfotelmatobacter sp.]
RPVMKKISTAAEHKIENVEGQKLTSGLDLGDRSSWYCVLNETEEVLLERRLATTPQAIREVFGAGRVAAIEILKSTLRTREYVEKGEGEGKTLLHAMRVGGQDGMQHFDGEIERLIR